MESSPVSVTGSVIGRGRSSSAPNLTVKLSCSSYCRRRRRESDVEYEKGKDRLAHWIGAWNFEEVCGVLQSLLSRCPLPQLEYLCTVIESVPHRDYQLSALHRSAQAVTSGTDPDGDLFFRPLSTPLSREVGRKLARSRKTENKRLFRARSAVIHEQVSSTIPHVAPPPQELRTTTITEATLTSRLPGLRPSTAPSRQLQTLPTTPTSRANVTQACSRQSTRSFRRTMSSPSSRCLSPMRRHMQTASPTREMLSAMEAEMPVPSAHRLFSRSRASPTFPLSPEARQFLAWFSSLIRDWQQQEILQLLVWNLDHRELYYLAILLLSRQYRDFVFMLPEPLALRILVFVPPRDILRNCSRVSQSWESRCSSEILWEVKCHLGRLGLPMKNFLSWKSLFLDDLRLQRNWRRGRFITRQAHGHRGRVLCVRLKDNIIVTGSTDRTIRLWSLATCECLGTLEGHQKSVWCVCFYGKNLLISGSSDCTIKVWNHKLGTCERTLEGHQGTVLAVQQKEDILISGSRDKTAIVWDIRHCRYTRRLEGHQGAVYAVDLDDSATTAFTGSGDKSIIQWEVASGERLRVMRASRSQPVMALHWNQGYLVSSAGVVVSLWSVQEGRAVLEFRGHEDRVDCVQLNVHDIVKRTGRIISGGRDKTIKYWDIRSGRCLRSLCGHEGTVNCTWSDEIHIVSASDDQTIKVWDFHPHSVHQLT